MPYPQTDTETGSKMAPESFSKNKESERRQSEESWADNKKPANIGHQLLCMSLVLVWLQLTAYLGVIGNRAVTMSLLAVLWLMLAAVLFWKRRCKRRLATSHMRDSSSYKKKLAGGAFMFSVCLVIAAPIALGAFLALSQGLNLVSRLGLVASVVLWIVLESRISQPMDTHVKAHAATYIRKRLTFWLIGGLLVLSLLFAKFWLAVPDLSQLGALEAFRYGQAKALGHAEWLHSIAGIWTGFDYLFIWAAERIGGADASLWMQLGIWIAVLLKTLAFVASAVLLLQGASVVATRNNSQTSKHATAHANSPLTNGLAAIVGVCLMTGFIWDQAVANPWGWLTGQTVMISVAGHAYQLSPDDLEKVLSADEKQVGYKREQYIDRLSSDVDDHIDRVFDSAIKRVPDYADWHFSVTGKASRFLAHVSITAGDHLQAILFPDGGLESELSDVNNQYRQQYEAAGAALETAWINNLKERLKPYRAPPQNDNPNAVKSLNLHEIYAHSLSAEFVNGGRVAGEGILAISAGSAAAILTRSGPRNAVRRGAEKVTRSTSKIAGKAGEKSGMGIVTRWGGKGAMRIVPKIAAGGGLVCGPAAVVCSTAAFIVVTGATEYILLKYDEYANKDRLESNLVVRLNKIRESVKSSYHAKLNASLGPDIDEINSRVKNMVLPADYLVNAGS